jgi:alkylhydroperoxidase family enzyme
MRIPPWTPDAAPRDAALVAAIVERRGGKLLNLDRALLWSQPLARGWNGLLRAVRQEFAFSPRLKELGVCTVAKLTGAHYEFIHHLPEYAKAGGPVHLLDKLDDPDAAANDPAFSTDERLVIRYAIAMTRDIEVSDSLFAEIRARFSETEIVELTAAIATYNLVARLLVALRVEPER